jgi:predicted nucleic acid-binding protein
MKKIPEEKISEWLTKNTPERAAWVQNTLSTEEIMDVLASHTTIKDAVAAFQKLYDAENQEVVPKKYRTEYAARGNPRTCSDDFSELFAAATYVDTSAKRPKTDINKVYDIAEKNGLGDKFTEYEGKGLNTGMIRMNIGNILRARLRKGETLWWPNQSEKLTPAQAGFDADHDVSHDAEETS